MKANTIRVIVIALAFVAVAIAAIPLLVLVDLAAGGTGFGACPDGIENCPRPYTAGAEMVIILGLALFAVVTTIRILMRMARRLQQEEKRPKPVAAIEAESSLSADSNQ